MWRLRTPGLGDPDVGAGAVDVGRQLVRDAGVDRVEGEGERQREGNAPDGDDEPDPVAGQVAAREAVTSRSSSEDLRRLEAGDEPGRDQRREERHDEAGGEDDADRRGLDRRRGTAVARPSAPAPAP